MKNKVRSASAVALVLGYLGAASANAAIFTQEFTPAEITFYDCLARTVLRHGGKCIVTFEVNGVSHAMLAAPEVAAPYSNAYGPREAYPMSRLKISAHPLVDNRGFEGEILWIADEEGRTVSKKIDYGR